jgi:hypothetical protein
MGAICNGIALHNTGLIPYCATFYIFTDYMRSAMRMSALSEVGTQKHVCTHACCCGSCCRARRLAFSVPAAAVLYAVHLLAMFLGCRLNAPLTRCCCLPPLPPFYPPPATGWCGVRNDARLHWPG